MHMSRRNFVRALAGVAGAAAAAPFVSNPAMAGVTDPYRAMVGIFLYGGNDGWNMIVPTDTRYPAYAAARGSVALKREVLNPLTGSTYALHPAMNVLRSVWDEGALGMVLNTGTLKAPLTKDQYKTRADLRPRNLMSHPDEQAHWQGMRASGDNPDGFMGRLSDRATGTAVPSLVSVCGSDLALLGNKSSPLILPATGGLTKAGQGLDSATNAAVDAFSSGAASGMIAQSTATRLTADYAIAGQVNTLLSGTGTVESYFVDPATGAPLTSNLALQLLRVARMIEARQTLGHARQTFFVGEQGYDHHANQVDATDTSAGAHAVQLADLAQAMAAFYRAMKGLGLSQNVTLFTLSDFGRTYKGNAQLGTDHAWGNNHLVMGGALQPFSTHGIYPTPQLGGPDDVDEKGRFIPTTASEEYVGSIARWHGVAEADMPYVFPSWSSWTSGGRGPLSIFRQ